MVGVAGGGEVCLNKRCHNGAAGGWRKGTRDEMNAKWGNFVQERYAASDSIRLMPYCNLTICNKTTATYCLQKALPLSTCVIDKDAKTVAPRSCKSQYVC